MTDDAPRPTLALNIDEVVSGSAMTNLSPAARTMLRHAAAKVVLLDDPAEAGQYLGEFRLQVRDCLLAVPWAMGFGPCTAPALIAMEATKRAEWTMWLAFKMADDLAATMPELPPDWGGP